MIDLWIIFFFVRRASLIVTMYILFPKKNVIDRKAAQYIIITLICNSKRDKLKDTVQYTMDHLIYQVHFKFRWRHLFSNSCIHYPRRRALYPRIIDSLSHSSRYTSIFNFLLLFSGVRWSTPPPHRCTLPS